MGFIAPVLGAVGSLVSGFAGMQAGNYQAAVAEQNAQIAEQNAQRSLAQGERDAMDQDMQARAMLGDQTAALSASGVSIKTGSGQRVRESSEYLAREDRRRIIRGARYQAIDYRQQAANFKGEAQMAKAGGANAMLSGFINAGTSIMGSASGTSPKWNNYKSTLVS